ncbi:MAG: hypothetical protein IPG47_00580 [Thermoflexaceae bacterium]|nr:hypothetical protein [Thermoflexaceae bacterium]
MQHVTGEHGEEGHVRVHDDARDQRHRDDDEHATVANDVAQAAGDTSKQTRAVLHVLRRVRGQPPGEERGEREADGLQLERALGTHGTDQRAADRGAYDAHGVATQGVQRDGVRQVLAGDAVVDERHADGPGEGFHEPRAGRGKVDHPQGYGVGGNENREDGGDGGAGAGVDDQLAAPFEAIREVAADGRQEHQRRATHKRDDAKARGRAAQVVQDEPAHADGLHPRADLQRHGAAEQDAEIAVGEGRKRTARGRQAVARRGGLNAGERA